MHSEDVREDGLAGQYHPDANLVFDIYNQPTIDLSTSQVERVCEGCNEEMVVRAFCAQTDWLDVSGYFPAFFLQPKFYFQEKRDFGVITIGPRGIKLSCTQCVEKVFSAQRFRLIF